MLLTYLGGGTVEACHQVWQAAYLAHCGGGVECGSGQVDAYRWAVGLVRWVGDHWYSLSAMWRMNSRSIR